MAKNLATRQAQYRDRRRRGLTVFRIKAHEERTLQALLNVGWLTPEEALDRRAVHEALEQVLTDWAQHWLKK